MKLGSLFSGFGGLDLAIEQVFGAKTVWVSDIESGPCKVLAHHWPGVPNLGDITTVDWSTVEPVDIIAGGSPCQDISSAGRMAGMREGTRSNLWVEMREGIRILQPALVIWENVSAARSTAAASAMESDPRLLGDHPAGVPVLRTLGRVLGDLESLGYDAQWHSLRASDIGAPHGRLRYFILAWRRDITADAAHLGHEWGGASREWWARPAHRDSGPVTLLPTPAACNPNDGECPETWLERRERVKLTANNGNGMGMPLGIAVPLLPTPRATRGGSTTEISYALGGERSDGDRPQGQVLLPTPTAADGERSSAEYGRGNPTLVGALLPTPSVADSMGGHERRGGDRGGELLLKGIAAHHAWGPYQAAIERWERVVGPAPAPTKTGRTGRPKLNPEFACWMMGAAPGWITDVPGVTDNEALRMAGNGVVQQQAEAALRIMWERFVSLRKAGAA